MVFILYADIVWSCFFLFWIYQSTMRIVIRIRVWSDIDFIWWNTRAWNSMKHKYKVIQKNTCLRSYALGLVKAWYPWATGLFWWYYIQAARHKIRHNRKKNLSTIRAALSDHPSEECSFLTQKPMTKTLCQTEFGRACSKRLLIHM